MTGAAGCLEALAGAAAGDPLSLTPQRWQLLGLGRFKASEGKGARLCPVKCPKGDGKGVGRGPAHCLSRGAAAPFQHLQTHFGLSSGPGKELPWSWWVHFGLLIPVESWRGPVPAEGSRVGLLWLMGSAPEVLGSFPRGEKPLCAVPRGL